MFNRVWGILYEAFNSFTVRLAARFEQLLKWWLINTRQSASSYQQYVEYLEAMIAESAVRQEFQETDCAKPIQLFRRLLDAIDFLRGVIQLTWDRFLRVVIFCYGTEQLHRLGDLIPPAVNWQ